MSDRAQELREGVIDAICHKCESYTAHPKSGELRPDLAPDLRIFPVKGYVVLYLPTGDGIYVVRVFHGAQDYPGYFA